MVMVNFDQLNRQTREWNNTHCSHPSGGSENGRMGMSPSEYLAYCNNQTFRSNNGSYPERPYGPYGTYSTGR